MDGEQALRRAILSTPIIDNHAHPLLKKEAVGKHPLLAIATEAGGDALDSSRLGLAHMRSVKQLSALLRCNGTWEAVEAAIEERRESAYSEWTRTCLSGIQCVLVDDGLDNPSDAESYSHFDRFTHSAAKRIVRIEQIAAGLIEQACTTFKTPNEAFTGAMSNFTTAIKSALSDAEVVGFKSVICYRTGLAIPATVDKDHVISVFTDIFHQRKSPGATTFTRVDHPGLNDHLVHCLASLIQASDAAHKKPIQFHTGLGDNDITLTRSSPSHLQEFIRQYPGVPIVLLHSGYPFVRESSYLATMYSNVYTDIGEVFPFLSRGGQEGVVRQTLELCPSSKILWSTDGHWFPETYFLAVIQMREVLDTVLCDFVRKGDLTWKQAIRFVEDMLFHNSNKLYDLNLEMAHCEASSELPSQARSSNAAISRIQEIDSSARFLRVCFNDMTATTRMRAIPIRRVFSMLRDEGELSFGIAHAALGVLQIDMPVPGASATGEWRLHPDFSSLRLGPKEGYVTAMGTFKQDDGSSVILCPRTSLQNAIDAAAHHGLSLVFGFEIELVLMRRTDQNKFDPLDDDGHAWSVARAMDHHAATTVIEAAVERLDAAGVYVEMIHAESANGQYEIVLPKAEALQAVDTLLFARDVISSLANENGYKMTLHPKPFANACGTAAHVHMSISSPNGSIATVYEPFYAGILKHFRALVAFTCSNIVSYERVQDSFWAGGTYVAWGTQNRETPLRKIKDSHWELKIMDGLANPYLAMSAIILAGVDGLVKGDKLSLQDCKVDPASLSAEERTALGVTEKLPSNITEALAALEEDHELRRLLGEELTERYLATKKAETSLLEGIDKDARRNWIIERY